jgi:hypothetical protein
MNLVAKPIIKNQFWVVTDGERKVGNVESQGTGFDVKINGNVEHYDTTKAIEKIKKIEFERIAKSSPKESNPPFALYPTGNNKVYNSVLDVKRKLHLFTKESKSKCYHVAGWFAVKQSTEFSAIFCPKYIFIQRYDYYGPYNTEDEVKSIINTI